MPFTPEDLSQLQQLIQLAVSATLTARPQALSAKGEGVDEKYYRKLAIFKGDNFKDFAFQFKSATRGASELAHKLLVWAENEDSEIDEVIGFADFSEEDDTIRKISAELFNIIITMLQGEPLQLLQTCNYSGLEAWRRLSKRYSPSTPLRAIHLMLQIINPGQAKTPKEIQNKIDKWESQVLVLERDFKEKLSNKMKAAIALSMLPPEMRDSLIQQADKFEEYTTVREKIVSIVDAKLAMRSPDEMEVDIVSPGETPEEWEPLDAVGKGGIFCYRCGGQGHIAAKCATPDPGKAKGKGKSNFGPQVPAKGAYPKGGGKSPNKGKGKGDWKGFCSYCGKRGHGPSECWTKQKDEANGNGALGVVDDAHYAEDEPTIGGFDVGAVDILHEVESEWSTVGKRGRIVRKPVTAVSATHKGGRAVHDQKVDIMAVSATHRSLERGRITVDSGAAESVMPRELLKEVQLKESEGSKNGVSYRAANGTRMPNYGEKRVEFQLTGNGQPKGIHNITFQVTDATRPLAAVSKIVQKGNRVVFDPRGSYIENIKSGQQIGLIEVGGTYQMDVEYVTNNLGFPRQG